MSSRLTSAWARNLCTRVCSYFQALDATHLCYADNVGDNVGDIAGMGADLFGSFAESTCAALVVASVSSIGEEHSWTGMMFPLAITAAGIVVCLLTTLLATDISPAQNVPGIEPALKTQLVVSTAFMTPVVGMVAFFTLPTSFTIPSIDHDIQWWYMFVCVTVGLWGGLIIGLVTEYYTSNAYKPVQEVASACRTGAATNVIFGLALGYLSCIIPVFVIAAAIFTGTDHLVFFASTPDMSSFVPLFGFSSPSVYCTDQLIQCVRRFYLDVISRRECVVKVSPLLECTVLHAPPLVCLQP